MEKLLATGILVNAGERGAIERLDASYPWISTFTEETRTGKEGIGKPPEEAGIALYETATISAPLASVTVSVNTPRSPLAQQRQCANMADKTTRTRTLSWCHIPVPVTCPRPARA
jgi:hypothetical protein